MSKVSDNTPAGVTNTAIFVEDVTDQVPLKGNDEVTPAPFKS